MARVNWRLALSVIVVAHAAWGAQAPHTARDMSHDSDDVSGDTVYDDKLPKAQIDENKKSDDKDTANSRSGRQLSRYGKYNQYDNQIGSFGLNRFGLSGQDGLNDQFGLRNQLGQTGRHDYTNQFGLNRYRNTNHLGGNNYFGTSGLFGSSGLDGLSTHEIRDVLDDYESQNQFGGSGFGSRLYSYPGSAFRNGLDTNLYSNAQLQGNRLGTNFLQRGNLGTIALANNGLTGALANNGLLANQRLGSYRNNLLGNNLLTGSLTGGAQYPYNPVGSFAGSQRFGSQALSPEGLARTVVHDSQNDGFGQYSYQFETDNGIVQEQTGQPVGLDSYAVTGSYSYTSPEGELVSVKYVADENGFQVDSPNLPPIPEHSRLQVLAAQQARNLGLVDNYGNPTGLRSSNYQNYHNENALGAGYNNNIGLGSGRSSFLNSGYPGTGLQNYNSLNNNYRTGNLVKTAVFKRPIPGDTLRTGAYNQDSISGSRIPSSQSVLLSRLGTASTEDSDDETRYRTNVYRSSNNVPSGLLTTQTMSGTLASPVSYPQLTASNRFFRLPQDYINERYNQYSLHNRLGQYNDANSFPNINGRISTISDPYSAELLPRFERLRANDVGGFGSPFFRQTSSRFAIRDDDPRHLSLERLRGSRAMPADIGLATSIKSPISSNVASYIYRS